MKAYQKGDGKAKCNSRVKKLVKEAHLLVKIEMMINYHVQSMVDVVHVGKISSSRYHFD